MGTAVPIPLGSYQLHDPRASTKHLVGCFSVPLDTDAVNSATSQTAAPDGKQPSTLQRMHGIKAFASLITPQPTDLNVRGFDEMAGIQYVVAGQSLYTLHADGTLNLVPGSSGQIPNNTTPGASNFVRMTNNTECLVILIPNTNLAWTYAPAGGGFQQLVASMFLILGAIDCWFVDTYIVFLAAGVETNAVENGSYTFYNDDGTLISGSGQITFTLAASFTREFGTDLFVGGVIDHREILLFGSKTSEGYVNVGASIGTPFQGAPDSFMHKGCHHMCAYTIAMQDEAPFWVANDLTVRRRNGQTPVKVSTPGVDQFLQTANLAGCYALTPTIDGHPLWVLTCPNQSATQPPRSIAYDCLTQKWFDLVSMVSSEDNEPPTSIVPIGYWRPLCWTLWRGMTLLGDGRKPRIGVADPNTYFEYDPRNPTLCQFTTQGVYSGNNRITHRRLECVITPGDTQLLNVNPEGVVGPYNPQITLYASDNGRVYESFADPVFLGAEGDYDTRQVWWNLGQSRNRNYMFQITDPTQVFVVDIQAELQGGKW